MQDVSLGLGDLVRNKVCGIVLSFVALSSRGAGGSTVLSPGSTFLQGGEKKHHVLFLFPLPTWVHLLGSLTWELEELSAPDNGKLPSWGWGRRRGWGKRLEEPGGGAGC